jgi:hypothetical protein
MTMWLATVAAALVLGGTTPCSEPEVKGLVTQFIGAYNGGSAKGLKNAWSQRFFRWYSASSPERHSVVYTRRSLLRYAANRHQRHETLALRTFKFNGNSAGHGHFEYAVVRRADDLNGGEDAQYYGKGAAVCGSLPHKLVVWSMGFEP